MGNYAVVSDVDSELSTYGVPALSGSTDPTSTEAGNWITQYEALINQALMAQGYGTIPATGTNDVPTLQMLVAGRVAAKVYVKYFNVTQYPDHVRDWIDAFNNFLKALRDGDVMLQDQSPTAQQIRSLRASLYTGADD